MLILYTKPGCQYCAAVLRTLEAQQLPYETRSVLDPDTADEVAAYGKRQTPLLVDQTTGDAIYDSRLIIDYLHAHYAAPAQS